MRFAWYHGVQVALFVVGYLLIVLEGRFGKINKSMVSIAFGVGCWAILLYRAPLAAFMERAGSVVQLIAMTLTVMSLISLIHARDGFYPLLAQIHNCSKKKVLAAFFLCAALLVPFLGKIPTAILFMALLEKLIVDKADRILLICAVLLAVSIYGSLLPLWTSPFNWLVALSMLSIVFSFFSYFFVMKGRFHVAAFSLAAQKDQGWALGGLATLVGSTWLFGQSPLLALAVAQGYLLAEWGYNRWGREREFPIGFHKEAQSLLFLLGILLAIGALDTSGLLAYGAGMVHFPEKTQAFISTGVCFFSGIIYGTPIFAASMGIYDLITYPLDSALWMMIAYAVGQEI